MFVVVVMIVLFQVVFVEDVQFDKMCVRIVVFVGGQMEKFGGLCIVYWVDVDVFCDSVVIDLCDDVYKILWEDKIVFLGLMVCEGGVELKVVDFKVCVQIV